jgi:hypothetical protein
MTLDHHLRTVEDIIALLNNPDENFAEHDLRAVKKILNLEWIPTASEVRSHLIAQGHIED